MMEIKNLTVILIMSYLKYDSQNRSLIDLFEPFMRRQIE